MNEYLHQSAQSFENLMRDIDSRIIAAFSEQQPDQQGEWAGLSMFERGATWTYVINDQPFGDFGERLARALVQRIRQMLQ